MFVGVCRFRLMLGNNTTLKGKRQVVQRVRDRLKRKFNVAIGEVEELGVNSQVVIGFAIVGSDYKQVDSALKKILNVVNDINPGMMVDENFHVEQYTAEVDPKMADMIADKWEEDE